MYSKVTTDTAPRRQRHSHSQFEKTEEWALMKADLEKGIGPNEALQVVLTPEEKGKYGIQTHRRSLARFIKKYLATHNLPYIVRSFRKGEAEYFIVEEKRSR